MVALIFTGVIATDGGGGGNTEDSLSLLDTSSTTADVAEWLDGHFK
jgi:hypothetical protein